MKLPLKKLSDQRVVITGASSGIGLTTARAAAKRGAKLILSARNEAALRDLAGEINANGGQAVYVVADVGVESDVMNIAQVAEETYGGFDTWIHVAGVGIFGPIMDGKIEDYRRLFETNFWGVVYGSLTAARAFIAQGTPAALIVVGSSVGDRATAYQGVYSTSKHAVKGFIDALRVELEADKAPISITLIKPGAINTPFPQHARNYFAEEPMLPAPVYAPELVAEAIIHCTETPKRDVIVGGGGRMISAAGDAPGITDKMMETEGYRKMQTQPGVPAESPMGALHGVGQHYDERGNYPGHTRETSLYTSAVLNPYLSTAVAVVAGTALAALIINKEKKS